MREAQKIWMLAAVVLILRNSWKFKVSLVSQQKNGFGDLDLKKGVDHDLKLEREKCGIRSKFSGPRSKQYGQVE